MAQVKAPFYGSRASGGIGKALIYQPARGLQIVRGNRLVKTDSHYFFQRYFFSETAGQQAVRNIFKQAKNNWKNFTQQQKDDYNELGEKVNLSGYSFYLKEFINGNYQLTDFIDRWAFSFSDPSALQLFNENNIDSYLVMMSQKNIEV